MTKHSFLKIIGFSLLLFAVMFSKPAVAQRQGLYLPGISGLNSAVTPPPGVYMQTIYLNYFFEGIKDQNGKTLLPNLNGDMVAAVGFFSWISPFKVLKAHYATNFAMFGISPNLDFNEFAIRGNQFGFGDIYFEPFSLMWGDIMSRYGVVFSYGFYAPTGKFEPGGTENVGRGTWTHQLNAGATVFLDKQHTWSITNWLRGEIHQKTEGTDLTIGSNLNWEWAVGKTFIRMIDVGLVGYGQWQLTDDKGSGAILPGLHDRVYGLGGELGIQIPQIRSRFAIRGYGEFGARLRTEGHSVFLTFSSALWNNKMPGHGAPEAGIQPRPAAFTHRLD